MRKTLTKMQLLEITMKIQMPLTNFTLRKARSLQDQMKKKRKKKRRELQRCQHYNSKSQQT